MDVGECICFYRFPALHTMSALFCWTLLTVASVSVIWNPTIRHIKFELKFGYIFLISVLNFSLSLQWNLQCHGHFTGVAAPVWRERSWVELLHQIVAVCGIFSKVGKELLHQIVVVCGLISQTETQELVTSEGVKWAGNMLAFGKRVWLIISLIHYTDRLDIFGKGL